MIITKKSLPRRTVLRGIGATIALPLLDGMVPAYAALRNTAARPTARLGIVYVPMGAVMENWTPASEGAGFALSPILQPLASMRDQLLVLTGLDNQPAVALPGEPAGGHGRIGAGAGEPLRHRRVKNHRRPRQPPRRVPPELDHGFGRAADPLGRGRGNGLPGHAGRGFE